MFKKVAEKRRRSANPALIEAFAEFVIEGIFRKSVHNWK
jgi:hypothetical protein